MKQVVQNYRSGELDVLDVPIPACKPGGVLVASRYSLISTGTEMMKVSEARLSLVGKAKARPEQVRKAVDAVAQAGPVAAYKKVMTRLDSYTPLGYSLSGVVLEVGRGAEEFTVGQLVACAGNEHALHAEVNWVPKNLCVPVPNGVEARLAAFATVGAIALHGVRRTEAQLGETACVVGLGLVGQLVVRLLVAAGVRVVGLDVLGDRCVLAEKAGALACSAPSGDGLASLERTLMGVTDGLGADHVLLTAGATSNEPVTIAARLARDRAHVVDIGKCRLDLPWNEYYEKELDVRFSRSYGPGRYDNRYELEGVDYPAGYVRWTERRNLACFLDLLGRGNMDLGPLVSGVYPISEAADVYERLRTQQLDGVGFLFTYPEETGGLGPLRRHDGNEHHRPKGDDAPAPINAPTPPLRRHGPPTVARTPRIGFVGAGNYASLSLLPHLADDETVQLAHVATTTSLSAANAQRRFGFTRASTDACALLEDDSIDAVFIVTRHRSHAELTCRALEAGKTVFVEKPLALTVEELDRVLDTVAATGNDRLMVGFNRRFAPLLVQLRSAFGAPTGPAVVRYLVNAGRIDAKSWYGDGSEGTRFEGEGGHFIDTISWWLDSEPVQVHALETPGPNDLLVTLRFDDGSVATIAYTSNGSVRHPKELFDATANGRVARLENFRRATLWTGRRRSRRYASSTDKGQRAELAQFLDAVRSGGPMPIPMTSLVATTKATLAASHSLTTGLPESVGATT